MRRFFLFIAALCCMVMTSVNALADPATTTVDGNKLYLELDDVNMTAKIVREKMGSDNYKDIVGKLTLPSVLYVDEVSYRLTVIGANAFAANTTITEIEFAEPSYLTTIESNAFSQCSALEKINIPSTVTEIPYSSFYKSALYNNDANYEDGILYIDGCLIAAKSSLAGEVTLKEGTRLIAGSAFNACKTITHVTLPKAVTYIGCNAFNNCSALEQINFPASLNFIGDNAFLNCKLRDVYLKSPLTIGKMAFFATTPSIQTVVLPKGESTFEDYAFAGQPGITRINVYEKDPSKLHMGTGVFDDVDKEKCIVYVPHELNGGSVSDFKATDEWSTFIIQSNNVCADGLFFELNDVTKKMTLTYELYDSYFNYCTLEENVDMVSNIHAIHAFDELGYTLTSVGARAFELASQITSITLPETVEQIGMMAFSDLNQMKEFTIPEKVNFIGEFAFSDCTGLEKLTNLNPVPQDITGKSVFYNVKKSEVKLMVPPGSRTAYLLADIWGSFDIEELPIRIGDLYYYLNDEDDYAEVTYQYELSEDNYAFLPENMKLVIPSEVTYNEKTYDVRYINSGAFRNCDKIYSVEIPGSVLIVGSSAFNGCKNLESATLNEGVKNLEMSVFEGCSNLWLVSLPSTLKQIDNYVFKGCKHFYMLYVYNPIPVAISDKVFEDVDKSQVRLFIPYGSKDDYLAAEVWKELGKDEEGHLIFEMSNGVQVDELYYIFDKVNKTATVTFECFYAAGPGGANYSGNYSIPSTVTYEEEEYTVTSIGDYAFWDCYCYEIEIPASVSSIGNYAFANVYNFGTLTVNNEIPIDIAGKHVFENCPQDVLIVPVGSAQAYREAEGWKDFETITEKGAKVGELYYHFDKDAKTAMVTFEKYYDDDNYNSLPEELIIPEKVTYDEVEYTVTEIEQYAFLFSESLKKVTLPATLEKIGVEAFDYCNELVYIDIPTGVTSIGEYAFSDCHIETINLPENLTSIENGVFYDCSSLTSITIPQNVTSIGDGVFYDCSSLTSITIPQNVTSIGDEAFFSCSSLSSITCYAVEPPVLGDDVFGNIDCENIPLYVRKASIDKYKAADQWKDFKIEAAPMCGNNLFWEIKDGVLTITGYGYMWNWDWKNHAPWHEYNDDITSVQLPDGLTSIGDYAFWNLDMESIDIPAGVMSIGESAFSFCAYLVSIDLPAGLTSIGGAFYSCGALSSISVPEENEHFCDIDGVLFNKQKTVLIKYPAHREGDSYTVPEGVTSIGQDAFDHSILKTINLPKSLTDIGAGAFDYCYALKAIDIPAGVTNIGEMAFSECGNLSSVTCRAVEPPVLGDEAFSEYACKNIPLFVPKASLDKYKAAELWKEFAQIDSYDATVTFLDKDGNLIEEQYVVKGEGAVAPEAPEVEGYHFTGWDKAFDNITGDLTVKAVYAINTYTVKFYDHSDNVISTQTVNWNEAALEPELAAWEGHTFTSWSVEFDHVKSNLDIKPIYDVETYKVTFVGFDGETSLKVENVQYGQGATAPEAPAVEGYTFTGWDKEFDNITGDLTVKAVYERNYYKLTLVAEHGSIAITDESGEHSLNPDMIEHGQKVRLIATADDGYVLKEWSTGETEDIIFVTVTSDKTVTATFVLKSDEPTGIDNVEQPSLVGQKVLRDGKLFIIVGGKTYNAAGQLVR
ncbi:MAG: leucine-rich repeat protein [Paludibacteraceae bacterium]|nr:leucine-rich repeat protein [Paludibacteraceae bacterium]